MNCGDSDMSDSIPLAKPSLGEEEIAAAGRVLRSGWITQGPEVAAFEKEFAAYVGASYACAVSNCTAALHLALLAVGVKPGDEVITVSHSFIATANAICHCQAVPVFVDIEPETFNMAPDRIEPLITDRTRAILCVHQIGMPCDLAAILAIARRHHLFVVEDAACAIGSEIWWDGKWDKIGKPHGDIACFSFHPRKVMTTGDGGMITTANLEWDHQFRLRRHHGMSIPDTIRHRSKEIIFESYLDLGFNYRLTDIQAAVGREQLKRLPELLSRRRYLAAQYHKRLVKISALGLPLEPPWAKSNWQSYCVRLPLGKDQREVMQKLSDEGIATRKGVMCSHREPAYQTGKNSEGGERFRVDSSPSVKYPLGASEAAQDQCIILPLYPQMADDDLDRVVRCLTEACRKA
jgi:perosamine synthetase